MGTSLSGNTFLIREARPPDLRNLLRLARGFDSPRLPKGSEEIRRLLEESAASFDGKLSAQENGRYLFVLEESETGGMIGCSLLLAKTGRPGIPHVFLTTFTEVRASVTLNRSTAHNCLRLGSVEDGPTELGGRFLLPGFRRRRENLEAWLALAPLLYIAAHPDRFQTCVMSESPVLPPQERPDAFWNGLGRRFTGLSYPQALRAAAENKEFLLSMFPRGTIYERFLPAEMKPFFNPGRGGTPPLPKEGFRPLQQINPLDGSPTHGTLTREVSIVRSARELQCFTLHTRPPGPAHLALSEDAGRVRMAVVPLRHHGVQASLSVEDARRLALKPGDWFWASPYR